MLMSEPVITLCQGVGRNPATRLAAPVDFVLNRQEHVAIVGPNGGGKSLLVDLLTGRMPLREGSIAYHFPVAEEGASTSQSADRSATSAYGNILVMKFEDAIGTVENPYYYQQRFNSQDRDESPLMRDSLPAEALQSSMLDDFMIRPLLDKRMVLLSSGEMRRYQLFRHLLETPCLLIIDNPFIGLDAPMREQLDQFFARLVAEGRVQVMMLLSRLEDVPEYMTHVVEVDHLTVGAKVTRAAYVAALTHRRFEAPLSAVERESLLQLPVQPLADLTRDGVPTDEIVSIRNLSLTLDEGRVLYGGLDWTVRRGEKWVVRGRNGSGKSTLLSLICADHPAAYACDISLFGRRRGTGESIWEIKKNIGFVSPEFHRAYHENFPAIEIVASGLHDSVGLYKRPRPEQMGICEYWMSLFGIAHLRDRLFLTLSSGEQRLCLLARAFVKDPALLILDEPFHGLDTYRRHRVMEIIETFCQRPDKTLLLVTHYEDEMPSGVDHRLTL
jgi:molybdate transport system ATP-binding protein